MKKGVIFCLCIIVLIQGVYAIVGVSPPLYEIDFQPNLEQTFYFRFIFDEGVETEVYVEGDLAQYVELDKDSLIGGGEVTAVLKLPSEVEVPGTHILFIGAKQISKKGQGFGIVGDARGTIKVKVPYPGKYAQISFTSENVNLGEPIALTINVNNLGKENIDARARIRIFESEGKFVEEIDLGSKYIETTKSDVFSTLLDTTNYKAGDYNATAIVEYSEKTAEALSIFRLGKLYVGMTNYTKEFDRNKINRIEIQTESFWNELIGDLYAEVKILNYDISTTTPSMIIKPWTTSQLTGFFDTTEIKEEVFQANITLHYEGQITSEIVDLRFKKQGFLASVSTTQIIIVAAAIVILLLVIIVIILLKRRR